MARKKIILCQSLDELMQTYFPKLTKEQKASEREADELMAKTAKQEKGSLKLRGKKGTNSITPYFDQYKDGKRVYEYLKEFSLNIESNEQIRLDNIAKMEAVKKIYVERKNDLLLKGIGIAKTTSKSKGNLIEFINLLADEQLAKTGNKHSYYYILKALAKHIIIFSGEKTTIKEVDDEYCRGFLNYLKSEALNFNYKKSEDESKNDDRRLTPNHQHHLLAKFGYVLNNAVSRNMMASNPLNKIPKELKPKAETGTREFLDIEEIKLLYKAECKQPQLKQSFLFCCLTGLRFSDVSTLKWEHLIINSDGEMSIKKNMVKLTKEYEGAISKKAMLNVPVSVEAQRWLPTRGEDKDLVFSLSDNETTNDQLQRWMKEVGITKKITFHCSRHTTATLNLSLGVPIAEVSKLLGHTKISTTQIYADIMQDTLKSSVSKQNGLFD